jgi:nucleoside-diphosphate-sugar epimerase
MFTLITGCTGVVGVPLSNIFRQNKEKVFYLVRNGKDRLDVGDSNMSGISRDQVIEGELTLGMCGVSGLDIDLLSGKINKVIHIAGSVKFDDKLRDEIWDTNVNGTRNVLNLAKKIGAKEFHFVSTAYAETQRNAYEQSKYEAENLVKNSGMEFSIYRIGIVVGDSTDGEITDYTGYYGFFEGLHRLAERQRESNSNKIVDIPIWIDCSFRSTLNLVPRNWLTETMFKLMQLEPTGKTFYITHPNPLRVNNVMRYGFNTLGISGIMYNFYIRSQPVQRKRKLKIIQKMVNSTLERYKPYVTKEKTFPLDNTKSALGEKYKDPPEVTPELLKILLNFAISNNFGKKKSSTTSKVLETV